MVPRSAGHPTEKDRASSAEGDRTDRDKQHFSHMGRRRKRRRRRRRVGVRPLCKAREARNADCLLT
jgi:hypothetical protein